MLGTRLGVTRWQVVRRGCAGYAMRLDVNGVEYVAASDDRLGSIMAAFREILALVAKDVDGAACAATQECRGGSIEMEGMTVERTATQPGYRVVMESQGGVYRYEAYTDVSLESVIGAMAGAMKFFAVKHGVAYVYEEVIRNVDRAHEEGFES